MTVSEPGRDVEVRHRQTDLLTDDDQDVWALRRHAPTLRQLLVLHVEDRDRFVCCRHRPWGSSRLGAQYCTVDDRDLERSGTGDGETAQRGRPEDSLHAAITKTKESARSASARSTAGLHSNSRKDQLCRPPGTSSIRGARRLGYRRTSGPIRRPPVMSNAICPSVDMQSTPSPVARRGGTDAAQVLQDLGMRHSPRSTSIICSDQSAGPPIRGITWPI